MIALVPALAGALIVAGIIGIVLGLRPTRVPEKRPSSRRMRRLQTLDRTSRLLLFGGLGAGVIAWLITGWMLAVVAVPIAAAGLPMLLSASGDLLPEMLVASHLRWVDATLQDGHAWLAGATRRLARLMKRDYDRFVTIAQAIAPVI